MGKNLNANIMKVVEPSARPKSGPLSNLAQSIDRVARSGEGSANDLVTPSYFRQAESKFHLLVPYLYVLGNFRLQEGSLSLGEGVYFIYSLNDMEEYSKKIAEGRIAQVAAGIPVPEDFLMSIRDAGMKYVEEAKQKNNGTPEAQLFRREIDKYVGVLFLEHIKVKVL